MFFIELSVGFFLREAALAGLRGLVSFLPTPFSCFSCLFLKRPSILLTFSLLFAGGEVAEPGLLLAAAVVVADADAVAEIEEVVPSGARAKTEGLCVKCIWIPPLIELLFLFFFSGLSEAMVVEVVVVVTVVAEETSAGGMKRLSESSVSDTL